MTIFVFKCCFICNIEKESQEARLHELLLHVPPPGGADGIPDTGFYMKIISPLEYLNNIKIITSSQVFVLKPYDLIYLNKC